MTQNTVDHWSYHTDETLLGIERHLGSERLVTALSPRSAGIAASARERVYRVLLIVRGPRNIAVSSLNYDTRMDLWPPLHRVLAELADDDARLLTMIEPPADVLVSLPKEWRNDGPAILLPWLDERNRLTVGYEGLVGSHLSGRDALQRDTIRKYPDHIGENPDKAMFEEIACERFGKSGSTSFHQRHIDDSTEHFNAEQQAAFNRRSGDVLMRSSYEDSFDW